MKRKINFNTLKKMIMESKEDENAKRQLEIFKEEILYRIYDNNRLNFDILKYFVDTKLSNRWESYDSDNGIMLSLNVKGYGNGNWREFNKNNRAVDIGINFEIYDSKIHDLNMNFFNQWDKIFQRRFGIDLYAEGRSGGHWGFMLNDLIRKGFELKDDEIQELYKKTVKIADEEYLDYPGDLAAIAYDHFLKNNSDIEKYVEFKSEFLDSITEFEDALVERSNEISSSAFNDKLFDLSSKQFLRTET